MKDKLPYIINDQFKDSVVLIAGAGGTIGSGLVNSIQAKTIIAVDSSEYAIYKLQRSIDDRNIHCIVGDISDPKICSMIFDKYQVDYVFNAAAYKHVDTLEDENNTYSVVKNNIMSTLNLCCYLNRVKGFVHISSDKAVNPTNNMGYTKLWCEKIVQHCAERSSTPTKIVRFGNVFNSAGSFIETLQWQIENGLPITITDERMKRYFLTINDAVMLINAVVNLEDLNATYILEMGEEVSIVDIVNQYNNDNPIQYIGIRPGEKLREELVYDYELLEQTSNSLIKRVSWKHVDMSANIEAIIKQLREDKVCVPALTEILTTITTS